jgi:heme/copper-type cytochrome/quinol oxidase subunit 2
VPTISHLLLAATLTLFLAYQAVALVAVYRARRALAAGRRVRRTEILWTLIPVIVVLTLAARSWVAVLEAGPPAVVSAGITPAAPPGGAPPR